jgi:hypothetical protein
MCICVELEGVDGVNKRGTAYEFLKNTKHFVCSRLQKEGQSHFLHKQPRTPPPSADEHPYLSPPLLLHRSTCNRRSHSANETLRAEVCRM